MGGDTEQRKVDRRQIRSRLSGPALKERGGIPKNARGRELKEESEKVGGNREMRKIEAKKN